MFKGLHSALHKAKPIETTKHPGVIPIQSGESLLASEKRQQYLKNIKALLNLPPKLYDNLYYKVIDQFAKFSQSLPETQYGVFNNEGGFLDHGLERASRALSLCLAYFFPQEKTFQAVSSQEALWVYAVFTAALLLDIGKIGVKYHVSICNKDSSIIKDWLPYSGPMAKHGKYYKYNFVKQNRDSLRRLVTPLLAKQILQEPESGEGENTASSSGGGFNWIASNPDVLEAWLTMLSGDTRAISSFMTVIPIADAQVIENYLATKQPIKQAQVPNLPITTLFENSLPAEQEAILTNTEAGRTFLQWLRDGLANNTISVNMADSNVNIVSEGVLLNPDIFRLFIQNNPQIKDTVTTLEQQFRQQFESYLRPLGEGTQGQYYRRIGGLSSSMMDRYLLITNIYLLFALSRIPPVNPAIIKLPAQNVIVTPSTQQTPLQQTTQAPHATLLYR